MCGLQGSELIIHAGDVGKLGIIEALERLAPVVVVRGNVDKGNWRWFCPRRRSQKRDPSKHLWSMT
jgi:predicted phosphodiesterase